MTGKGRPETLKKLSGAPTLTVAVYFTIRALMEFRGRPVCPDDPDIFRTFRSTPRAVREATLDLIAMGLFRSERGYLHHV